MNSDLQDGMNVTCGGIVSDIHKMFTKNGNKPMAVISIEDLYGTFEVMLFNKIYEKVKYELQEDAMLTIKGHLSLRDGQKPIIIADSISFWNDETGANGGAASLQKEEVVTKRPKTLYLQL